MSNAVLVAVRLKSSRLKRKALLPIAEYNNISFSLVDCLITRLKLSNRADFIVICTSTDPEDDPLQYVAAKHSIKCYRGDTLDVMSRFIEASKLFNIDTIVRVTGDNPFVDSIFIDELFDFFSTSDHDIIKIDTLPLGMGVECFSVSALCRAYKLSLDPRQSEYMTAYLFRKGYFDVLKYIPKNFSRDLSYVRLTVDYFEDLQLCQLICRLLGSLTFDFFDLVDLIDNYPALFTINANVKMIPLPRIRFSDQPDYSHCAKAYLLIDDPLKFDFESFNDWTIQYKYYVEGIYQISKSCIYTMHSDLPVLGTVSDISSQPSDCQHLLLSSDRDDYTFIERLVNYQLVYLPQSMFLS